MTGKFQIHDDKVPCLTFYIQPYWDHRRHKVSVALPENWGQMSETEKIKLADEYFAEWRDAQIEDSGWVLDRAYPDELTDV